MRLSSHVFLLKQKRWFSQSRNVIQPEVEWHLTDVYHPGPSTDVHTFLCAGTSKHLNFVVVGNHKELRSIRNSTIDIDSWESYMRKYTYVDINPSWELLVSFWALNQNPWRVLFALILVQMKGSNYRRVALAPHKYLPLGRENEMVIKRGL